MKRALARLLRTICDRLDPPGREPDLSVVYALPMSEKSSDTSPEPQALESDEIAQNVRPESRDTPPKKSSDTPDTVTADEADERIELFLDFLAHRGTSGTREADDLRALYTNFCTFARADLRMTDKALFAALKRADVASKQARMSRSDPRYPEAAKQSESPRVRLYVLP